MTRGRWTTLLCWASFATLVALPASATAQIGIESFSFGASSAKAGAHPDLAVTFSFEGPGEPETAQEAVLELPPGFWFYPEMGPLCTPSQFTASSCPIAAQVGTAQVWTKLGSSPHWQFETGGVYSLLPQSGDLARLGFNIPPTEVSIEMSLSLDATGDALDLSFEELPPTLPIASLKLDLWGVPASPAHDEERFPFVLGGHQVPGPLLPFTRNPTSCSSSSATLDARSYEDPAAVSTATADGPTITSCENVGSSPSLNVTPSTGEAATASGLNASLLNPQDYAPKHLSTSDLKALALDLDGLELDAATTSSHSACALAQLHLGSKEPAACPAAANVGSFTATAAGVEEQLEGGAYFGGADGAGRHRLFLTAASARLELKLPAWIEANGETWIEIPELPQLPLEEVDAQINPSASLFVTAPDCGIFPSLHELETWSAPSSVQLFSSPFTVDSGPGGGPCPVPTTATSQALTPSGSGSPARQPKAPTVSLSKHPAHRGHDRTPSFSFVSSVPDSTFRCEVDRRFWRPCRSPLTLRKLTFGKHAFRVKATAPSGAKSPPLVYRFVLTHA
jgi:hypothetical protein